MKKDEIKNEQAIEMYKKGVPVDELCSFLRIGPDRLYDAIDDAEVPRRTRRNNPRPTKKQISEAVRLYTEGEKIDLIVVTTSVSRSALIASLKRKEIPIRAKDNWIKKRRREKGPQMTTNIVMLQKSYGEDFVGLCNRVLRGKLDFQI